MSSFYCIQSILPLILLNIRKGMTYISILVYKQRFQNPNRNTTASKNYAHVRYIATRPRVDKNEGMNHGLFGKLVPDSVLTEFEDWQDIARLVYQNSKAHITMYRSVLSFDESVAHELLLSDKKAWERYIENHIRTIAELNGIRREHFQWAAALHKERGHPHIHVVFWDTSCRVKNPFTPPAVPNAIRKQIIKDTFAEKIRRFAEKKNLATTDLRQISNDLVEEFERHMRILGRYRYENLRHDYDENMEISAGFDFKDQTLNQIADKVFKIKSSLPKNGRISYQLLQIDIKQKVDQLVYFILLNTPALQKQKEEYVQSKMAMVSLYGGSDHYINEQELRFEAECDKIIANRILGMVKTLNRLDKEIGKMDDYQSHKSYQAEQLLFEALEMLKSLTTAENNQYKEKCRINGDLSKEERKEILLRYQDKGYEH